MTICPDCSPVTHHYLLNYEFIYILCRLQDLLLCAKLSKIIKNIASLLLYPCALYAAIDAILFKDLKK